ncbi:MAG: hypothetical protein BroJett012_08340 [Betaproteobacteria bacterium]|nr:MAG: hypothetical protein BroJett012_08340 [Betaproteobacteria bacterium]
MKKKIEEAFAAGRKLYGDLHENDVQLQYANRIGEIIACAEKNGTGQAMVEAETGVGKTLGYLVPALLHSARTGERAVISTFTLQLQRQIMAPGGDMERAIAMVAEVTGKRLTAALRIGKRNFVDADRVRVHLEVAEKKKGAGEVLEEWGHFLAWAEGSETGQISEFLENECDHLPGGVEMEDVSVNAASTDAALARYQAHVDAAKSADVVVTNHAMLVRTAFAGWKLLHDGGGREIGALILDECDRLPDVARDATSALLPMVEFEAAARKWNEMREDNAAGALIGHVAELREQMAQLCPEDPDAAGKEGVVLWSELSRAQQNALALKVEEICAAAVPIAKVLLKETLEMDDAKIESQLAEYLKIIHGVAGSFTGEGDDLVALRWSPARHYPSFRVYQIYPARTLKRLWSYWMDEDGQRQENEFTIKAKALILTSATISSPTKSGNPDFSELKIEMGIYDKTNACQHLSGQYMPHEFGRVRFVFPDKSAPTVYLPRQKDAAIPEEEEDVIQTINPDWVAYAARMVARARKEPGRILVLANSYRATAAICAVLREQGIEPVEKTRARRQAECVADVIADERAVFVTPSGWEGLDLSAQVKNAFRHVIVTQLPYHPGCGVRERAIMRHLTSRGLSDIEARNMVRVRNRSSALRKFKQGFGRGIRGYRDEMTFWVCDPRFPACDVLENDLSGVVPLRTVKAHKEFAWAIPKRFRVGAWGFAWDDDSAMFLADGRLVSVGEVAEMAGA